MQNKLKGMVLSLVIAELKSQTNSEITEEVGQEEASCRELLPKTQSPGAS